jgi:hypothetical protein
MASCCALQCFQPTLASVGPACAITPNVCGGGVGTASCGMSQVTVTASKPNIWPWVIGIGLALYLLSRHHKG